MVNAEEKPKQGDDRGRVRGQGGGSVFDRIAREGYPINGVTGVQEGNEEASQVDTGGRRS